MLERTTSPTEPTAADGGTSVAREVETVRTRERVVGAPVDAVTTSRVVTSERTGGYFETLPERLGAVGLILLTALEGLLAMRFVLYAFGANASSSFVNFIDNVSWPFVRPFADIFSDRTWDEGVIEVSTLVAMGVYLLVFALIGMLISALAPRLGGGGHGAHAA